MNKVVKANEIMRRILTENDKETMTSQTRILVKPRNEKRPWLNQPLRLTKDEQRNPFLILEDLFDHYELNEIREIFWEWFVEVISGEHSSTLEPYQRRNHIFFYEQIEALVEACFIIHKRQHKKAQKAKG